MSKTTIAYFVLPRREVVLGKLSDGICAVISKRNRKDYCRESCRSSSGCANLTICRLLAVCAREGLRSGRLLLVAVRNTLPW